MTYRHVALMGKARSGKDSVAEHLVRTYAFTRVAFADPLKEMALRVNPLIPLTHMKTSAPLSDVVAARGWEDAKDRYPEVRRILQTLGASIRDYDEHFWLRVALDKIDGADRWNMPIVVTDVRYPNEAEALRKRGFLMVRVYRLGTDSGTHESETALDDFRADVTIPNNGPLTALGISADALAQRR